MHAKAKAAEGAAHSAHGELISPRVHVLTNCFSPKLSVRQSNPIPSRYDVQNCGAFRRAPRSQCSSCSPERIQFCQFSPTSGSFPFSLRRNSSSAASSSGEWSCPCNLWDARCRARRCLLIQRNPFGESQCRAVYISMVATGIGSCDRPATDFQVQV